MEVRLGQICRKFFGISPRHYRRLAEEGYVPSSVQGKINLVEASRDLIAYYRKQAEKKGFTFEAEKTLKMQVERKLKELTLSIRTGGLIPKSDIPALISERDRAIKKGLISFQRILIKKLLGKDAREMSEIIQKEVFRFLNKMSKAKKRR